jgi:hypothetical protein
MRLTLKTTLTSIAIFWLASLFLFKNWGDYMLGNGDSYGYYSYLPAFFLHHDLDNLRVSTHARFQSRENGLESTVTPENLPEHWITGINHNGKRVIIYPSGVALLQTPAFIIAHAAAKLTSFADNGYTFPYRFALMLNGLAFGLLGLFFLGKILRGVNFDETTTCLTISTIGLATNLYYFVTYNPWMSHNYAFFLVALFIWTTLEFFKTEKAFYLLATAFLGGFITLVRLVDGLILLFPFLYSFTGNRFKALERAKWWLLLTIPAFFLPFLPQMVYWHSLTGQYFFNSYGEHLRFFWDKPKIKEGLFEFKNGWLAYTPVMVLAIIGIFFLRKERRGFLLPIAVILPIFIYVTYSWWCWNYINGFGSRPMIDIYPILAVPLAVILEKILRGGIWLKIPVFLLLSFFAWLNCMQTYQTKLGVMLSEEGTLAFAYDVMTKTELDYDALVAFDCGEFKPNQPILVKKLYENFFEDSTDNRFTYWIGANGKWAYKIPSDAFSPAFKAKGIDLADGKWLRVSVRALSPYNNFFDIYRKSLLVTSFSRNGKDLKWRSVKLENKLGETNKIYGGLVNVWGEVGYFVRLPSDLKADDDVSVSVWCNNDFPVVIDDFKVELYR